MSTRQENETDTESCWNRAGEHEQVFILLGRDRHAPPLIRLWAEMREREGEDKAIVNEAREVAQLMEDELVAAGKSFLSLDAVSMFCTSLRNPPVPQTPQQQPVSAQSQTTQSNDPYQLRIGEIVVAGRGRPAKLMKVFSEHDKTGDPKIDVELLGMANIHVPGTGGPVTVAYSMLRRAMPEEVEAYQNSGGRL